MVYNSITARRPVRYFASDQEFEDFCVAPYAEIKETADGDQKPYIHGKASHYINDWQNILLSDNEYELLSDEEMDDYFKNLDKETSNNETQ